MRIIRTPQTNPFKDAAMVLAERGTPVFPCRLGGKEPLTPNGYLDASTDPWVIDRWWSRHPEANVATPTGFYEGFTTFDVLDVDVKGMNSGLVHMEILERAGLLDGSMATVRTPSGGLHRYLAPSDQRSRHRDDLGLDFQARGAYVLVPPSRQGGGTYELLHENPNLTGSLDWDEATSLLDEEGRRPSGHPSRGRAGAGPMASGRVGRRGMAFLVHRVLRLSEGGRNAGLFKAACFALRDGYTDLDPLAEAARCTGLGDAEIFKILDSARKQVGRG